jgi:TRAP-type C4-dicarboxylate transport system permease small subunit
MAGLLRIVTGLARLMALLGGAVLTLLVLITCLSIIGRALNSLMHSGLVTSLAPGLGAWVVEAGIGAIPGDFELVEAGMAFAIFAFLPYCTVTGGHASVDVFTNALPSAVNKLLDLVIALLFAAVLVLIAVQLNEGMTRKVSSGQTTLLLQFPVWWAYAACMVGAVASAAVGVYLAAVRVYELVTGRRIVPGHMGEVH